MKTRPAFRLLIVAMIFARLVVHESYAVSAGDDPVTIPNSAATPASGQVTTNPNAPAATTIQPPLPVLYGWPDAAMQGWNTLPPLPDVRYAVVPLVGHFWPANAGAIALDDLGDVLAISSTGPQLNSSTAPQLYLWKPGTATVGPSNVSVPLDPTWLPLTPSATIVLPASLRPLSSDGRVAGGKFQVGNTNGGVPGGVAAVWSSATNTTTTLSPLLPVLEDPSQPANASNFGRSVASVVNASGTTLGWEWHHGLDGNGNPADSIGGTFYDPVASTVGLLGPDANPYTGPYYFPAALNDSGAAVVIKSINGPASARLTVFDSTGNHDLGPILPGGDEAGLAFQSLTNGFTLYGDDALAYTGTSSDPVMLTQPVVLTLATPDDDAPTELWWAHGLPGSTGGDTIGWADPAPVELWDVAHSETISQRMAPPTFVRSNVNV